MGLSIRVAWVALARCALPQSLREADRRPIEIEGGPETIFKEALIAEVQRPPLIGEKHEHGRRGCSLGDVIDFYLAAGR